MATNFTTIGINFNVFDNITFEGLNNFTNLTKTQFIESIPTNANTMTNDYYGVVVLVVIAIFLIQMFSDISQYGLFRYSTLRSIAIALGIVETLGAVMLSIGYMTNFIHLSIIGTLYVLLLLYIIIYNPS